MKTLSMDSKLYKFHNFTKSNLVTNMDGSDSYVCQDCGLKGKRFGLNEHIDLIRPSKVKLSKCSGDKGVFEIVEPKKNKIIKKDEKVKVVDDTHLAHFGYKNGDKLEVVECPNKKDEDLNGVWVMNKENPSLPIRLLPNEYETV